MGDVTARIQSVEDARELARRRLPKGIFQYYDGGSGSDVTTRANLAAFEQVLFRPHVARWIPSAISAPRSAVTRSRCRSGSPRAGSSRSATATASAASRARRAPANTLMFVSGATSTPIEEIMAVAVRPDLLPARLPRRPRGVRGDRRAGRGAPACTGWSSPSTRRRPRAAPGSGRSGSARACRRGWGLREAIRFAPQVLVRAALARRLPARRHAGAVGRDGAERTDGKPMHRFDGGIKAMYKETPRWEDIPRLRELWQGPLIVKGILRADDARAGPWPRASTRSSSRTTAATTSTAACVPPRAPGDRRRRG